jgi:Flavin containing amine oxidoreductase
VPDPVHAVVTRWGADEWSRGSYSYVAANSGWEDIQVCTSCFTRDNTASADSHHYMTVISLNISHAVTCTDVINVVALVNSRVQQANNDALSDALAVKQLLTQ